MAFGAIFTGTSIKSSNAPSAGHVEEGVCPWWSFFQVFSCYITARSLYEAPSMSV